MNWTTTESNRLHVGRWDNVQRWTSYCTVNASDTITNSCGMQAALYCFQQ